MSMNFDVLQSEIVSTSYNKSIRHDKPNNAHYRNRFYTFVFSDDIKNFIVNLNTSDLYMRSNFEEELNGVLRQVLSDTFNIDSTHIYGNSDVGKSTNIILSGFNASTNIPKTMDRVAAALTNRFRDISNLIVQGQSGSLHLHIRVS